jgi:hypothetical protein
MNAPHYTSRIATVGISWALAMALAAPAVFATPPENVLERARQAVAKGQQAANDLADLGGVGSEQKAKGLENASAAIEAAVARQADREGREFPGNGKALGRGHSELVHEYLGLSPSELPSHGEAVSTLARAYEKVKADHPGQGEGLEKEKPARGPDDGNKAESDDD